MEIINNICLSDGNRAFIRDAGFVPVVQEFLHLSEKRLGLTSLAILAGELQYMSVKCACYNNVLSLNITLMTLIYMVWTSNM